MQHQPNLLRLVNMKKRILFAFVIGTLITHSCSGILGSGKAVEETRTVSGIYKGISVERAIRVHLSDNVSDIHVRADELFMPFLDIYINEQDILVIKYSKNMIGYSSVTTEVTVPCHPLLTTFEASGASRIDATCDLALNTASFEASGASLFSFTGSAVDCEIILSGASRFEGFDFTAVVLDCELSGASRLDITCTGSMKVEASGASKVNYKGDCIITSIDTSGGSEVNKK